MYFGMRGHDFDVQSVSGLAAKCKEHNIKGVQLALKKTIPTLKAGDFTPAYATEIGDILRKSGVRVSVLGCYINPSQTNEALLKEDMDFFLENLQYAKYMGADMVGLETGFVGETLDITKNQTEEAYQYLLSNMKTLCREAERLGVTIGIEGVHCFVIHSPARMKRLLDDLNSDNTCVIFDPVNYMTPENYQNQETLIEEAFELLHDKIKVLHLKDFVIKDGIVDYEYPTKGLLDTKRVLRKMKQYAPESGIILENVREEMLPTVRRDVENLLQSI